MASKAPYFNPHPHMAAIVQAERNKVNNKLYNSRWRKARITYLKRNPLCASCERDGKVTEASQVDHIIPVVDAPDRFWDTSNWQALCGPCHSSKTARENTLS